jgi:Zn-dependent protease with chaperone function
MNTLTLSFPPMPVGADKNIIKPSASFTKKVYNAIAAIGLFVLSYIFLLLAAIGIAFAFGAIGLAIIGKAGFMSLVLGVGLILSGLMLVFFVIKFLFKKTHEDYSGLVEVNREEQPQLFAFIDKITEETNAPSPKRIFISADVNAGVFYDSSFWSMFFPVKKNLKIGLGLVNSVNVSEFKAVMAHEFGHFSQRSMKFGSYVYNLNKVIYNMLYDNEGYQKVLSAWSSWHSLLQLTALLNVKIIQAMQWMLRKVYVVLNKSHMALSREMEFHADAVAAYVTGGNHLVTSLKRIEIGQLCYTRLLDYWSTKLDENKRSANFYPQQLEMMKLFAERRLMPTDEIGLPVIEKDMPITDNSEVIIEDQWSSHPSTEDRELNLERLNLQTGTDHSPAWVLFSKADEMQVMLTNYLYAGVEKAKGAALIDAEAFKADYEASANANVLDKRYRNYYDRNITEFDIDAATVKAMDHPASVFDELFTAENCGMPQAIERMEGDAAIMDAIMTYRDDIKNFDYKGNKYSRNDAYYVKTLINAELTETEQAIAKLDEEIFIYFYNVANTPDERIALQDKYKTLFDYQPRAVKLYEQYNDVMAAFNKVYNTMPHSEIHTTVDAIYAKEKNLKPVMSEALARDDLKPYLADSDTEAITHYLNKNWVYFNHPSYDNEAIAAFTRGTQAYIAAISKRHFEMKKDLLNFQLNLLENRA